MDLDGKIIDCSMSRNFRFRDDPENGHICSMHQQKKYWGEELKRQLAKKSHHQPQLYIIITNRKEKIKNSISMALRQESW
jgi:hypothetical protein